MLSTLDHIQFSGIIPTRPVAPNTRRQWKDLAQVFVRLLGGNPSCQQAANYLNALADDRLPAEEVSPLTWHEEASVIEVMPIAREEPHPVVLATLSPSVPLRAVWRRRRWYKIPKAPMFKIQDFRGQTKPQTLHRFFKTMSFWIHPKRWKVRWPKRGLHYHVWCGKNYCQVLVTCWIFVWKYIERYHTLSNHVWIQLTEVEPDDPKPKGAEAAWSFCWGEKNDSRDSSSNFYWRPISIPPTPKFTLASVQKFGVGGGWTTPTLVRATYTYAELELFKKKHISL